MHVIVCFIVSFTAACRCAAGVATVAACGSCGFRTECYRSVQDGKLFCIIDIVAKQCILVVLLQVHNIELNRKVHILLRL